MTAQGMGRRGSHSQSLKQSDHGNGREKIMRKFSIASTIAAGFVAAAFALAAPASAGIDHHSWLNDVQQHATVGSATSMVGNGR